MGVLTQCFSTFNMHTSHLLIDRLQMGKAGVRSEILHF